MKENKVLEKGIKYNVRVTDLLLFYILNSSACRSLNYTRARKTQQSVNFNVCFKIGDSPNFYVK